MCTFVYNYIVFCIISICYLHYSIEEFYSFYDIQKLSWNKVSVCIHAHIFCVAHTHLHCTQLWYIHSDYILASY